MFFETIEKMSIEELVNIINITTEHYYNKTFPDLVKGSLTDFKISPAKIVNIRLACENEKEFLSKLFEEMK